jgi:hypothetical protein
MALGKRRISATAEAVPAPARQGRAMTRAKLTVRLEAPAFRLLIRQAEARGVSPYAMLAQVVETGFAALDGRSDDSTALNELAREMAAQGARIAELERLIDRTLFTSCAAYAYARNLALGTRRPDDAIAAEALAAFERQRALAQDISK